MRDILAGIITIAAGICLAVAIIAATIWTILPARIVTIDLSAYACAVNGATIKCERK